MTDHADALAEARMKELYDAAEQIRDTIDEANSWEEAAEALADPLRDDNEYIVQTISPIERLHRAALAAYRSGEGGAGLRPQLAAFASLMERRLRANDHKGGWAECKEVWLFGRLGDEASELAGAIEAGDRQAIANEAADVANFAMMLADVSGDLEANAHPQPSPYPVAALAEEAAALVAALEKAKTCITDGRNLRRNALRLVDFVNGCEDLEDLDQEDREDLGAILRTIQRDSYEFDKRASRYDAALSAYRFGEKVEGEPTEAEIDAEVERIFAMSDEEILASMTEADKAESTRVWSGVDRLLRVHAAGRQQGRADALREAAEVALVEARKMLDAAEKPKEHNADPNKAWACAAVAACIESRIRALDGGES